MRTRPRPYDLRFAGKKPEQGVVPQVIAYFTLHLFLINIYIYIYIIVKFKCKLKIGCLYASAEYNYQKSLSKSCL